MLDVVSYLFSELLYTVVAFLVRHQSGKLFEKLLQDIILLKVFEFLELGVVNNVALNIFEALLDLQLHHNLIVIL